MTHDLPHETLSFGYGETALGLVLVALSGQGEAAILLGDTPAELRHALAAAHPKARLVQESQRLAGPVGQVVAFVASPGHGLDLALDLRGSALERAVWDALRRIPCGETRSYGALASAVAIPATAREVGAACAANRVAIAVPCQQVVKADGAISGYRWGVHRKRRLLAMEAAA